MLILIAKINKFLVIFVSSCPIWPHFCSINCTLGSKISKILTIVFVIRELTKFLIVITDFNKNDN